MPNLLHVLWYIGMALIFAFAVWLFYPDTNSYDPNWNADCAYGSGVFDENGEWIEHSPECN